MKGHFFYPIWVFFFGGGGLPKGLGQYLLMQSWGLGNSKMEIFETDFFNILTIYLWRGGGGDGELPRGLGHNLLVQLSSLGSSKMEISKTDIFHIPSILQNDQISYVKRVLAPLYVVFTVFGCWGGGGVPRGLGHNPAIMQLSSLSSSEMAVSLPSSRCLAKGNRNLYVVFGCLGSRID